MSSLLIKNANLLTFNAEDPVQTGRDVLICDGIISEVVPAGDAAVPGAETLDAGGKWLLPGFVNAHTHAYSALVRGFGKASPALDFQQQLENLWWKLDKSLTLGDCYHSAVVLALDSIRHGTTTVIDHHASPGAVRGSLREVARAFRETGLRACLCYELSDRDGERVRDEGIAENLEAIRLAGEDPSGMLRTLFGLHASFTVSDDTLDRAVKACQGLGAGFHIHVAEALSDQTATWKMSGKRVVHRLAERGILGPGTIAAHCVHLDQEEIELLASSGTIAVHNPQSNLNNAVGIADVLGLLRHGVLVGLGTDAMTANMLEELRVALFSQHLRQNNPGCGFSEIAGLLIGNNFQIAEKIFGSRFGKIARGYAADCILFEYDPPTPLDASSWIGHLIYGFSQFPVDTTIVSGKVLMRNRVLIPDLDESLRMEAARAHARKLWDRFQP